MKCWGIFYLKYNSHGFDSHRRKWIILLLSPPHPMRAQRGPRGAKCSYCLLLRCRIHAPSASFNGFHAHANNWQKNSKMHLSYTSSLSLIHFVSLIVKLQSTKWTAKMPNVRIPLDSIPGWVLGHYPDGCVTFGGFFSCTVSRGHGLVDLVFLTGRSDQNPAPL